MRYEYKYVVPTALLPDLRKSLKPWMYYDSFAERAPNKEYTVRSIYLDTPSLASYNEKIAGVMSRQKLRVRAYDSFQADSVGFLEIKTKIDQLGGKYRAKFNTYNLERIFEDIQYPDRLIDIDKHFNECSNFRRFYYHYVKGSMHPTILVTYDREAYSGRYNPTLRITFDKNIRYLACPSWRDLYNDDRLILSSQNYFVLEVKFDKGFDNWLSRTITRLGLQRTSYSKYCRCIEQAGIIKNTRLNFQQSSSIASTQPGRLSA